MLAHACVALGLRAARVAGEEQPTRRPHRSPSLADAACPAPHAGHRHARAPVALWRPGDTTLAAGRPSMARGSLRCVCADLSLDRSSEMPAAGTLAVRSRQQVQQGPRVLVGCSPAPGCAISLCERRPSRVALMVIRFFGTIGSVLHLGHATGGIHAFRITRQFFSSSKPIAGMPHFLYRTFFRHETHADRALPVAQCACVPQTARVLESMSRPHALRRRKASRRRCKAARESHRHRGRVSQLDRLREPSEMRNSTLSACPLEQSSLAPAMECR